MTARYKHKRNSVIITNFTFHMALIISHQSLCMGLWKPLMFRGINHREDLNFLFIHVVKIDEGLMWLILNFFWSLFIFYFPYYLILWLNFNHRCIIRWRWILNFKFIALLIYRFLKNLIRLVILIWYILLRLFFPILRHQLQFLDILRIWPWASLKT